MLDSLSQYRQDHLDHAILTGEAERALLRRAASGDLDAIDAISAANQRLVMKIALRYYHAGMAGDLDIMDLVQAGNIGILEAIRRFDASRNVKFCTYAAWWIRALIRRAGLTNGAVIVRSSRQGELDFKVHQARSRLYSILGRDPRPDELAARAGVSRKLVDRTMRMMQQTVSLDIEPPNDHPLAEILATHDDTAGEAEQKLEIEQLRRAIAALTPREIRIISWRFGLNPDEEPLTLSEIGRRLGISRQRVQTIEQNALERLRANLG